MKDIPANRKRGMDQDIYVTRPTQMAGHARVALTVIVNLEHWDWEVPKRATLGESHGRARGPMGNPPDNNFPDIGGHGNQEYGNRVGIFRVLAVPDIHGIKPTFALDKVIAYHYPFLIKAGQKRDAEFIARGLTRRQIIHIGMSENEGRLYIRASIEAVGRVTGKRPAVHHLVLANRPRLTRLDGISRPRKVQPQYQTRNFSTPFQSISSPNPGASDKCTMPSLTSAPPR